MKVPFGNIENGVWKLSWEEKLSILEQAVTDGGRETAEDAEDEFWCHVNNSQARFMEKEFEEIPNEEWEKFVEWVLEDE